MRTKRNALVSKEKNGIQREIFRVVSQFTDRIRLYAQGQNEIIRGGCNRFYDYNFLPVCLYALCSSYSCSGQFQNRIAQIDRYQSRQIVPVNEQHVTRTRDLALHVFTNPCIRFAIFFFLFFFFLSNKSNSDTSRAATPPRTVEISIRENQWRSLPSIGSTCLACIQPFFFLSRLSTSLSLRNHAV